MSIFGTSNEDIPYHCYKGCTDFNKPTLLKDQIYLSLSSKLYTSTKDQGSINELLIMYPEFRKALESIGKDDRVYKIRVGELTPNKELEVSIIFTTKKIPYEYSQKVRVDISRGYSLDKNIKKHYFTSKDRKGVITASANAYNQDDRWVVQFIFHMN
jgi:hypothetical protein